MTTDEFEALCEKTHDMMMHSQGRMVSHLEATMDPCPAIEKASQMMHPAFMAWNELLALIEDQNAKLEICRTGLADIKAELLRQLAEAKPEANAQ